MNLQVALVRKRGPVGMFLFRPELFAVKGALQAETVACPIVGPMLDVAHDFRMKYFRFECLFVAWSKNGTVKLTR